jgi:hypothetical protein
LIEDFNWLAFSTPSPNWSTVPKEDRVEFPEAKLPEDALEEAENECETSLDDSVQFNDEISPAPFASG